MSNMSGSSGFGSDMSSCMVVSRVQMFSAGLQLPYSNTDVIIIIIIIIIIISV